MLTEKYQALDGWIWKFWLNRYSRLLPGYLVVLALSSILVSPQLLHMPNDTWQALLLKFNIVTMIGLEWPTFHSIGGHTAQAQVPVQQAWSLGIELMFYVVVPALSGWRTRMLIVLTAALVLSLSDRRCRALLSVAATALAAGIDLLPVRASRTSRLCALVFPMARIRAAASRRWP